MFSVDTVVVNTLAEFKALNIRPNQVVVKGETAINDGWGGTFVWYPNDSTAADDEDVIQCTRGEAGRYIRMNQRQSHLSVNGALAGDATFSVNGYAYIGSPDAQDPSYGGTPPYYDITIASITKANPGVVTHSGAHGFTTGDRVTFTIPTGMTELDGVTATITVTSSTAYSIGINTTSYSTYTNYATNHGRAAIAGTHLAETAGLTVRSDNRTGGPGIIIRNRSYNAYTYQNFANDAGDIEGGFQQNGTGASSLAGSRSFNIYSNFGDLGIYSQIQGTPVQMAKFRGNNSGAAEGFLAVGKGTPPTRLAVLGSDDTTTVAMSVYRSSQDFGIAISQIAATGHSSIYTVGGGSLLSIGAASTTGLAFSSTAVTAALPIITTTPTNAAAPFRIPHGSAPTSPVDGDIWTTTAGLYVRINGATVGPLS